MAVDDDKARKVAIVDHMRGHRDALSRSVDGHEPLRLSVAAASVHEIDRPTLAAIDGLLLQSTGPGVDVGSSVALARSVARRAIIVVLLPWVDPSISDGLRGCGADFVIATDAPLDLALSALATGDTSIMATTAPKRWPGPERQPIGCG